MLDVVLEEKGVGEWDWIIRSLAGDPPDPIRMKKIRQECTPERIAKVYAMNSYVNSAEYDGD